MWDNFFMKLIPTLLSLALFVGPVTTAADVGREFVMSCTYGTLAGTLVGAASLAFTKHPGDNLNHVARGASLGLYTGILLGAYVAWIVPRLNSGGADEITGALDPPVMVWPTLAAGGIDGVRGEVRVLRF